MGKWIARCEYENGETLERDFPYMANGNPIKENEEQYNIECWMLERQASSKVVWYSVNYED